MKEEVLVAKAFKDTNVRIINDGKNYIVEANHPHVLVQHQCKTLKDALRRYTEIIILNAQNNGDNH